MTETAATPGAFSPGQLFGAYRINRLLGSGGMGVVYEAESIEDGRIVALKLLADGLDDADARRRFLREGHLAAALNHPNTVYIYGTDEIDGTPAIAMELVAGGTLEERLRRDGPLPIKEAVEIALQIVDGLAAAQAHGILHRDIKPSNCFLTLDGSVKVGDFGLSKSIAGNKESQVTRTGTFIGTPAFSAPEQLLGEPLDVRSDIYSVGATLYNLLTGKLPFTASSPVQMIAAVMQGTPASPRAHRPEVPASLAAIALRCLQRRPTARYPDYEALRKDLERFRRRAGEAASIPSRMAAYAIDLVGVACLILPLLFLFEEEMAGSDLGASLTGSAIALVGLLICKGIPEALWGASIGKGFIGIEVRRESGDRLGLSRGIARLLMLWSPIVLSDGVLAAIGRSESALLSVSVMMAVYLAFLSTSRRSNGYSALHDLLIGSRVVLRSGAEHRERSTPPIVHTTAISADTVPLGPFLIGADSVGSLDGSTLLQAYDPVLRRALWIRRHRGVSGMPFKERCELARPGRLRWVAGRHNSGESWDAYEAPGGKALLAHDRGSTSWDLVRGWVSDLAEELVAAADSGEALTLGLDRVWIGANGRAFLLDFHVPPSEIVSPVTSPGVFLGLVARHGLSKSGGEGGREWPVLPLSARKLLCDLPCLDEPKQVVSRLREVRTVAAELSRRRRGLAMALTAGPALLFTAYAFGILAVPRLKDPQLAKLVPLLDYLKSTPFAQDSSTLANRATIGTYFAAKYREFLSDSVRRESVIGHRFLEVWPALDSTFARLQVLNQAEASQAILTVEVAWKRIPPGAPAKDLYQKFAAAGGLLFVVLLTSIGIASTLAALVFRLGFAIRQAGIEVVTARGERAGRRRLTVRALLSWLPLFGLPPLLILAGSLCCSEAAGDRHGMAYVTFLLGRGVRGLEGTEGRPVAVALIACVSLLLVGGLVSLVSSLRTPQQGIVDRLVGTYLVPK